MADEFIIGFGHSTSERIQFTFDSAALASAGLESEGWIEASVIARASNLRGEAKVFIRKGDFARLMSQLRPLYDSLRGTAIFDTLENQVGFTITGDGVGHMALKGFLRDCPGGDNRLVFALTFDQTLLSQTIAQIDAFYALTGND